MRKQLLPSLLALSLSTSISSCALFNPYLARSPAVDEAAEKNTGTYNARSAIKELKSKASQLAYWQSGSTSAIAIALGLGGYRAVDGGHAAQVAALAAGSATVYAFSAAQYKPEREKIYISGVQAVNCTMSLFEPTSFNTGKQLLSKLKTSNIYTSDNKSSKTLEDLLGISDKFYTAFAKSQSLDRQYNEAIDEIRASIDNYIADQQPSAEITYRILTSIISSPQPEAPDAQQTQATYGTLNNNLNYKSREGGNVYVLKPEHYEIIMQTALWLTAVESAEADLKKDASECNHFGLRPPSIQGITNGSEIEIKPNSRLVYAIFDSTGNLSTINTAQDNADEGRVRTQILVNEGKYSLEIVSGSEGTTKAVRSSVIDNGKGGFRIDFKINVIPQTKEPDNGTQE